MDIFRTHFQVRGPEFFADLPSYQFRGFLGEGSFGAVYKAVRKSTGEIVAIKINKTEKQKGESNLAWQCRIDGDIADFEREHRVLLKLKDAPNTLQLKAFMSFPDEGRRAIVTNCLDGSLGDLYQRKEATERILFKAFRHCLRAVDHLAKQGLAHRDIHPGNIFYGISSHQKRIVFVLGDFGLCAKIGKNDERAGAMSFRPPEMIGDGPSTSTSDIWSLFASMCFVAEVVKLDQNDYSGEKNQQALRRIDHPMTRDWMDCFAMDWQKRPSAADLLERCEGQDTFRGSDRHELGGNANVFMPIDIVPKGKSRQRQAEHEQPARRTRRQDSVRAYEHVDPAAYEQETVRPRRRDSRNRASNIPEMALKASSHRDSSHRPRASSRAARDFNYLEIAPKDSTRHQALHQPQDYNLAGHFDDGNYLEIAPRDSTRYQALHQPRADDFAGQFNDYDMVEIAPKDGTRFNAMHQPRQRSSSRASHAGYGDIELHGGPYEMAADPTVHQLRNAIGLMDLARGSQLQYQPQQLQQLHRQSLQRQQTYPAYAVEENFAPRGRRSSVAGSHAPAPSVGRRTSVSRRSSVQGRAPVVAEQAMRFVDDRRSRRSASKVPGLVAFMLG